MWNPVTHHLHTMGDMGSFHTRRFILVPGYEYREAYSNCATGGIYPSMNRTRAREPAKLLPALSADVSQQKTL
eukprot:m.384500 g.384500  ORF g.384500 m.384500 type:complete len:73 (+) comp20995_c0_seq2:1288-1506(+)